jgi:hypothetical protein
MATGKKKSQVTIPQLRINNFKCFDQVVVPLRPLTIIYGQNSSGKSTIFQAIDLIRIACWQLQIKQDYSKTRPLDLSLFPWCTGWSSIARDKNKPIKVGLTFESKSEPSSEPSYYAIDFELDEKILAFSGELTGLPVSIDFSFWDGSLAEKHNDDVADIYLRCKTVMVPDDEGGDKASQDAYLSVNKVQKKYWLEAARKDVKHYLETSISQSKEMPVGKIPYFKRLAQWDKIFQQPGMDGVRSQLERCLNDIWGHTKEMLSIDELTHLEASSRLPDLCHIAANEVFVSSDLDRTNVGHIGAMLRLDLANFLSPKPKEESRQLISDPDDNPRSVGEENALIDELNNALESLGIPHRIGESGISDTRRQESAENLTLRNIGYGVQYLLPRLLISYAAGKKLCCVEEPEAHVHPELQCRLGDFFLKQIFEKGGQRLLESHSENLILKIKKSVHDKKGSQPEFADKILCLYVYNPEVSESHPTGHRIEFIRLDGEGDFIDAWPKSGFFTERDALYY